jgi:DNA polymerase (family X)
MKRTDIAAALERIGLLLELKGENPFKTRAYQAGARIVTDMDDETLDGLIREGKLQTVKGVGEALSQKIGELRTTGRLAFLEKLEASVPPGLVRMLEVPGLGPKRIRALHEKLGIDDLPALAKACEAGAIAELAGFGEKSQAQILSGIRNREAYGRRHLGWEAAKVSETVLAGLRALPGVVRCEAAGSLRRSLETVGDLDFLVAAAEPAPIMDWFVSQPGVKEVTARGETKSSVRFESGLQADLRLVPEAQFAYALHHFTGSKDHNVAMRQRALARGLSLSEWGLTPVEGGGAQAPGPITTEAALFGALGLAYIPPELREGRGEIERAETGPLPRLVEVGDLKGAFHNHTTASDGEATLEEMVAAAEALGWEYLGIADHSKASVQARGLDEARLAAQVDAIRRLNASGRFKVRVLAGTECDILADGRLDFPADVLCGLDYTVVSVHQPFGQDEATLTARIIKAIEQPGVTMLGHLTGRLLLRREGYPVDVAKVIDAAAANGVVIELNANPLRLDMDWRHWARAAERGVLCSINPDAHTTDGLRHVAAGVGVARKAGLLAEGILNTRPWAGIAAFLASRRR